MRSMSCFCRKRDTTSGPKVKETPLSFSLQPVMSLSGSDQSRSQSNPQSGICARQYYAKNKPKTKKHLAAEQESTYISGSHHTSDLLHGVQVGAQTAVHCENLFVDDSGDGKAVETVGKGLPQLDVVPALAFVVETVDAVNGCTFVVATQDEEVFGVLDLVGQQEADGLERLLSSVDVVT